MKPEKEKLSKSQRIKLKILIIILGLLLLLLLFLGRLLSLLLHREPVEEPPQEIPLPVVEYLTNVWIMEKEENGLLIFAEGEARRYPFAAFSEENGKAPDCREQVADIELTDGAVTFVKCKTEKINGKILSVGEDTVEVEGKGKLSLAENYRGYRIYDTLEMCTAADIAIGYAFTDLVMEEGKICGILLVKEEAMEDIRVLIKTGNYEGLWHQELVITSEGDYQVEYGGAANRQTEAFSAGEEIIIDKNSRFFEKEAEAGGGRVVITPKALSDKMFLKNVARNQGTPGYRGHLELTLSGEGMAVVNELPLETYLYSVVPSEMPASYPKEALKAQAICARTYAYGKMLHAGYPDCGAHVDDSTSYQVYNNISEQEAATTAVKETYGQLLYTAKGEPAETYYYSTSCGIGATAQVWKTEDSALLSYIQSKSVSQSAMASFAAAEETEEKRTGEEAQAEEPQAEEAQAEEAQTEEAPAEDIGEQMKQEEVFAAFIKGKNADDFEVSESWYRWSYQVKKLKPELLFEALQKRYEANPKLILTLEKGEYISRQIEAFQEVKELFIEKRGAGGVADELVIETEGGTYKVISEYNIRYVLNDSAYKVLRQDGSKAASPKLLPSGFFVLDTSKKKENVVGYSVSGGGYGHGAGMSQNGAKEMAKCGYTAGQILGFFYSDCYIDRVYEEKE